MKPARGRVEAHHPGQQLGPAQSRPGAAQGDCALARWFDDPISGRAASLMEIAQSAGISRYVRLLMPLASIAPADS